MQASTIDNVITRFETITQQTIIDENPMGNFCCIVSPGNRYSKGRNHHQILHRLRQHEKAGCNFYQPLPTGLHSISTSPSLHPKLEIGV